MRAIDAEKFWKWLDAGHLRSPKKVCFSEIDVKTMIDLQPTIEVECVPNAKWDDNHKCTNCKIECVKFVSETGTVIRVETKHCPNCGAKMSDGKITTVVLD